MTHPLATAWNKFCAKKAAQYKARKKATPEDFKGTRIRANAPGWKAFKKNKVSPAAKADNTCTGKTLGGKCRQTKSRNRHGLCVPCVASRRFRVQQRQRAVLAHLQDTKLLGEIHRSDRAYAEMATEF